MSLCALSLCALSMGAPASIASAQTVQRQAQRPPRLQPRAGCQIYRGTVHGNDPSVEVELRICPRGAEGEVEATSRRSSLLSGWNTRALAGRWSADRQHLRMHDVRIVEQRPQPGWRFCLVDHYDYDRTPSGGLRGSYRSEACDDTAQISLEPVAQSGPLPNEPPDLVPTGTTADPGAARLPPTEPEGDPRISFFGCSVSSSGRSGLPSGLPTGLLAALLLTALGALRLRRPRRSSRGR